jgi:hypothetical protein
MIIRFIVAALCLFSAGKALAQIRVELSFEQETYLPREALYAVIHVYNSSGQTLELGNDNSWLSFSVESNDRKPVKEIKPVDVEGAFTLPSASRAKKMVNLAAAYDLTEFGRYHVTAMVRIPQWNGEAFASGSKYFGISGGAPIWESTFGVPSEATGERPEIRKYQLVQANNLKELSLYARIMDAAEIETLSIFPLGRIVGVSLPEAQVDRWNNLHVFYQDGARSFRYNMINPDGILLARQTWEMHDSRPALKPDDDGRISVAGGFRRVSPSDLPPAELVIERSTPPAELPVAAPKTVDAAKPKKK